MVRFYHFCSFCTTLYNVGVDSSLTEEVDAIEFACLLFEYTDKLATDNLTFLFGIGYIFELAEETVGCIYLYKVSAKLVAEYLNNSL